MSVVRVTVTTGASVVVMDVIARGVGATPYQVVDMESLEQFLNEECSFNCEDPTREATPGYEAVEEVGGEKGELKIVRGHRDAGFVEQA